MVFGIPKFHLRFRDRESAGKLLAGAIKDTVKDTKYNPLGMEVTILGIPRGGVVLADKVANELSNFSCFDIIIPRKLRAPHNEEIAIGAVMEDGTTFLDEKLLIALEVSEEYLNKEMSVQMEEINRRRARYLGIDGGKAHEGPQNNYCNEIKNKVVILVDDGAATGSTIIVAARSIRKLLPRFLIIGVPVAPKETVNLFKKEADAVEVITTIPSAKFKSVSQFYQSFNPVTDEEVTSIIQRRISNK